MYNNLFELFRDGGKSGHLFVLQFVPVLIFTLVFPSAKRPRSNFD